MPDFSEEEIEAVHDFMCSPREGDWMERAENARTLGLTQIVSGSEFLNRRGQQIWRHLVSGRIATAEEETAVDRFRVSRQDSPERAEVEAELFRLGLGRRSSKGDAMLNGWGGEIDSRWHIANR